MPSKTSLYLKSNTLRSRKPKRREPLSVSMISQPLGDFRHLSHIGMDSHGDAFGDLSFLKRVNSLPNEASLSKLGLGPDNVPPPPKPPRLEPGEDAEPQGHHANQRHKKCHSLPLLDSMEADEASSEEEPPHFITERQAESTQDLPPEPPVPEDDPPFSLNLDLGPSILEDVLRVMDKLSQ
ncbi:cdc42 effector protein 2-like [Conger conger]|uniref:cdc42 effector protein 2-like n=1 Tax=Conger conger TaxID=82655 RepID=UPI002A5A5A12|nr:cdc42 effector protein 2-like [Conger conger]